MTIAPVYRPEGILYPLALDESEHIVHIKNANGGTYYCPQCREVMIPKKGDIYAHHFAHKNTSIECNPETALHHFAKLLFKQRFESGTFPVISYRCAYCRRLCRFDMTACNRVVLDHDQISVDCGTHGVIKVKPDVIFYTGDQIRAAVEIVVTNPITPYKFALLHSSGVPVMVWYPTWELIGSELSQIFLNQTINVSKDRCAACVVTGSALKIGNRFV